MRHRELHRTEHIGWLRAAVLGANDGLISTSSLVVGVATAQQSHDAVLLAALAGLVAGTLSMAAGEYVSVSSQADTEQADLGQERHELATTPDLERAELAGIYVARGLTPDLAAQVADQLMAHDALGAHARDELGMSEATRARPIQAALASAAAFAVGAAPPCSWPSSYPSAASHRPWRAAPWSSSRSSAPLQHILAPLPWSGGRPGLRSGERSPWEALP